MTSRESNTAVPVRRVTDQLETPSLDDRDYRVIRLPNELEALLVHDPDTDKASAALDCNVGNFSDETDMPGMAHAVEHLLFMGTKKYPVENEYSQYLANNSGSSNAYTGPTSTNYFFEISARPANDLEPTDQNPSALKGALDRFAQFFIEPLFLESTLDRELRAVDSENKKNLQSDQWRLHQLEKSTSNPNHPYCHFSTGNLDVLKIQPEAKGINVREKFMEFHDKHYSANRMKLVVLGRESLDVLEGWVSEFFAGVSNKNLPQNRWESEAPFRKSELGIQIFAKPVMDSRELNLYFPFMDEERMYESQPSRYLSHLIGHEGPGSIMAYVKSKGWANGLSAGTYPVCPGTGGIFDCQIRLTEEGLKNYQEITKIFFQYVSLLQETSPQEWIFDEQKGLADVDFKFKQKTPASRFTSKISSVMQKPLPREWLLSGHSKLRKFDPELIREGLACLRPDNLRLTIVSRNFPGNWDRKEKWYGTEYRYEDIPADFLAEIEKAAASGAKDRLPELHLPHKNNFIPTNLEVEKKEVKEPALAPRIVRNDLLARTWFKKDDTFWVPKANLVISCRNPNIYSSAENAVKAKLFTDLVRDALEEYSYDAELAGLQYSVALDGRGMFLDLSGYNDKLAVLLKQVLVTIRDVEIKDARFDIIKERLHRGYNNWELQQPFSQVSDYTTWLNSERDYVVEEYLAELPNISAEDIRQFKKQMLAQMRIEAYVHGNIYKEDALKLTDMVETILKPRILPQTQWPVTRSLILPPGSNFVYKKTLKDPANVNHCLETVFYVGDKSDWNVRARTLLLDQIAHEPAFDQLRTKEQLGYVVFSGVRSFSTTYGFRFIIQSERPCDYLESRIEAFLNHLSTIIDAMTDTEFEGHKRSLIVKRLEKVKNLDQESSRHWTQIASEYYTFELAQQDAEHIKKLTKADMVEFYRTFVKPGSATRAKVSVHLVAQSSAESDEKMTELLQKLSLDKTAETKVKAALLRPEMRNDTENLKLYLQSELQLPEEKVSTVIAAAHDPKTGPKVNGVKEEDKASVDTKPQIITDVRAHRARLQATSGAQAGKDLSEYLDLDAKLSSIVLRTVSPATAFPRLALFELHRQLAITTSSSKKRKIAPRHIDNDQLQPHTPYPDIVLPSCEPDDDPALSFTSTAFSDNRHGSPEVEVEAPPVAAPWWQSAESNPASSLPARLQTRQVSLTSTEYPDSAASSPSGVGDLSLDSDRGGYTSGTETGPLQPRDTARSQSPFNVSRRAIMGGDGDAPQRSSSPLKRRASSMEPQQDTEMRGAQEVDSVESAQSTAQHGSTTTRAQLPRAMSIDLPDDQPASGVQVGQIDRRAEPPPLEEQIKTIQTLVLGFEETVPKVGDTAYVVSTSWVRKAQAFGDPKNTKDGPSDERLGPVDNSDIIDSILATDEGPFVRLRDGVSLDGDVSLFPDDAWTLVSEWYGLSDGQIPIIRKAINTAQDSAPSANIIFEINPPVFTIHRLWSSGSEIPIETKLKDAAPIVVVKSTSASYNEFFKELKTKTGIPLDRKIRVWSIAPQPEPSQMDVEPHSALTPPDSPEREPASPPESWKKMLIDVPTYLAVDSLRRSRVDAIDNTVNANYNGKSSLSMKALGQSQILVLDEEVERGEFVSTYFKRKGNAKSIASRGVGNGKTTQSSGNNSGRNSPAPSARSGPITRGRTQQKRSGRSVGAVGLQNLGNTCYMNSALQCVRSVEELTKYFLTSEYEKELNRDNPLGYDGQVAITYGQLLKEIYRDSRGAVSPREFKVTIGRCRSAFSGWGQQDTQEFLGFLLDGLQEDLSRIKKKPYIEKPDSTDEMIGNEEAIRKMAEEVWDITRKRDDSVIADLFTGMYKSTLKCPVCDKVSITFDPFNNLTLPLPIEDLWSASVKFFPLNDRPVLVEVELPKHSAVELLKKAISDRTGVPVNRLIGAEEFKGKFFKIYSDNEDASEAITGSDVATFHELESSPTNWIKSSGHRSMLDIDEEPYVDPRTEHLVVSVLHRKQAAGNRYSRDDSASPPHFIVLTREEANNEDVIRRKILEKIATFTTAAGFADSDDGLDPETVVTTQSDTEMGDSKVVAQSVEGEDDIVEVSMKDNGEPTAATTAAGNDRLLKRFESRRPKWATDSQSYLPPQLQNLFELFYFGGESSDIVPSGWNSLDRSLHKLSSRAPPPESSSDQDESNSPGTWTNGGDGDSDNDSTSDLQSSASTPAQTRMNEESSEEEAVVKPPKRPNGQKPGASKKKMKPHKTYGKKGNKRRHREMKSREVRMPDVAPQPSPTDDVPGPLVRFGEGIVVEWDSNAWDGIFGDTDHGNDDLRGSPTFNDLERLRDPNMELKRKKRQARRSKGITLEECLDEFEKAEILSEQDTWYCPRCKEHRRASKKFDLWKTPDILVVHLKRFSSSGYRRDKLDVLVDFPVEGLDLRTRVLHQEDGKEEVYDLCAVDEHFGGLGGGHYTAWAKNFVDNQWYHFNDTSVSAGKAESSVTKAAYLLFYRRRSAVPLGGPRFREICEKFDSGSEEEEDEQDAADSGEGRRLGEGSSPTGSSRLGTGAGAIRLPAGRGLAHNTMSTRSDDGLPDYNSSERVHNSIEDDAIGMAGAPASRLSQTFTGKQTWSFSGIGEDGDTTDTLQLGGYASDEAQADSDVPDLTGRGSESPLVDDLLPQESDDVFGPQEQGPLPGSAETWSLKLDNGVNAVPPRDDDDDAASSEAAEIHISDDSQGQSDVKS
ncbi:hypothetical protein ACHAPS_004017 [Verticillium nonalfalfae]